MAAAVKLTGIGPVPQRPMAVALSAIGGHGMRSKGSWGLVWGAFFIAGVVAPTRSSGAANCALWARAETGVALYGAAGGWWNEAEGRYGRGDVPVEGAILVFKRTGHTPSGHVAVVSRIIGPHEILIDHANWYRGTVSRGMSVIDTSPDHDWTTVSVIDWRSGQHGRDNPTYGFIYPNATPREFPGEIISARYSPDAGEGQASELRQQTGFFRLAVATDERRAAVYRTRATRAGHRTAAPAHTVHRASTMHRHDHAGAPGKSASSAYPAHVWVTQVRAHTSGAPSYAARTTE